MKRDFLKTISLTLVLVTVFSFVFALSASAQTWELTSRGSLEGNVLRAEYYDGVLTLSIMDKNGRKTSGSLNDFMTSEIPWRSAAGYIRISEVYFSYGITDLGNLQMLRLDTAEILHIPTSVTSLGDIGDLFGLKKICYGGTETQWNELAKDLQFRGLRQPEIVFEDKSNSREFDEQWEVGLYDKASVKASRCGDTMYIEGRGMMESYVLSPDGLDALAPWVLCDEIKHVVICDGVRNVGDYAFWNNDTIEDVVIAGSVTEIGEEAFYATGITEIRVPASVTTIEKCALGSCTKLTKIYLTQNVDKIGRGILQGCDKLETLYYGGDKYFWDKTEIEDGNEALQKVNIVYNYTEAQADPDASPKPTLGGTSKDSDAVEPDVTEKPAAATDKTETVTVLMILNLVLTAAVCVLLVLHMTKKNEA